MSMTARVENLFEEYCLFKVRNDPRIIFYSKKIVSKQIFNLRPHTNESIK